MHFEPFGTDAVLFWAIIVVGIIAAVAKGLFVDAAWAYTLREMFRVTPRTREKWVGNRRWLAFSKRFGPLHGTGAIAIAFVLALAGAALMPDTVLSAWLIFGPSTALIGLGVSLLMLRIARWLGDE